MKKLIIVLTIFTFLSSCDSSSENTANENDVDSISPVNSVAADSTKQPSGIDNSSVISTDTAAMNVQNSIKKADSAAKSKNK